MKHIEEIADKICDGLEHFAPKHSDDVYVIHRSTGEEIAAAIYLWHLEALKEEKERDIIRWQHIGSVVNSLSEIVKTKGANTESELQSLEQKIKEVKGE